MRRFRTTIVLVLATLLSFSICSAQQASTTSVPNLVRYSGTLKDSQGAVPTGAPLGVTFAIYNQQDGGAAVWMETQNVTPDANGQYSVVLGSTTAAGLPDDLFSQQEQRWLSVQVQGEAEQPRVLLVSVPYAFKAHEADTLGGLPASAFVKAPPSDAASSGSTEVGTAVNALRAAISTTNKPRAKSPSLVCPAPASGFVPFFSGTLTPTCSSVIFQSRLAATVNFVGIGTVTPAAQLDVNGSVNVAANSSYQIGTQTVLSVWESPFLHNLFVGVGAGQKTIGLRGAFMDNVFVGYEAGFNNSTNGLTVGAYNTYTGFQAGFSNTGGDGNTFTGEQTGYSNFGSFNTFTGTLAGYSNNVDSNSFFGYAAGQANTAGNQNTFLGYLAGQTNTLGSGNTFVGFNAGVNSADPAGGNSYNTFVGTNAGYSSSATKNTFLGYSAGSGTNTGYRNTAVGTDTFRSNTTGIFNACFGDSACFNIVTPTSGDQNTCLGTGACSSTNGLFTTASNNICVGFAACNNEGNVFNNIEIGNSGPAIETPGNNQILIGTLGTQTDTYIAGINGAIAGTVAPIQTVCVDANGKLWGSAAGCGGSSRRFKDQIADMGDSSSRLFQLRPVSFFYKLQYDDGSHSLQYGLIAEEVARVYPEMVVYDKDGQPSGVKYQMLAPMLLREFQKEHSVVMAQQDELQTQLQQIKAQRQEIDGLKRQLQQQNASLQERLQRLESYVATQMKVASDNPPRTIPGANGGSQ
jgi:hypothetical protein